MKTRAIDMCGKRCERLLVLWRWWDKTNGKKAYWLCLCDCDNYIVTEGVSLRNENTKSCGCLSRENASALMKIKSFKHGHSGGHKASGKASGTYKSWSSMRSRCTNPNTTQYENYGGRGIKVCERWNSFENFLADMGERPTGTTLDRYPNKNGNYEPNNCKWSDPQEQVDNRRQYQALDKYTDDQIVEEFYRRNLDRRSENRSPLPPVDCLVTN